MRLKADGPAPRPTLARSLVDFGVQVHVGERAAPQQAPQQVVGGIDIGGRPQGLFGNQHRSHTTAWVVFTDVVRNAVLNQPLPDAVRRMQHLIREAGRLPGAHTAHLDALRNAVQVSPADAPDVTGRDIYDRANATAQAMVSMSADALVTPIGQRLLVPVLQDLIAAYLRLRNATPLSVTHNVNIAEGAGEGSARGALAGDEAAAPPADAREQVANDLTTAEHGTALPDRLVVRTRLWALLDFPATLHLALTQPATQPGYSTVPGSIAGESVASRLAAVVAQHLITVRAAYPRLFAHSGIVDEDSLRAVLAQHADERGAANIPAFRLIQDRVNGSAAPLERASSQGVRMPATSPAGTAQIMFGVSPQGEPTVGLLRLGGRPQGVLGHTEGAHLTAFGLMAQELHTRLTGIPLTSVISVMQSLIIHAEAMPTAGRADALNRDFQGGFASARAQAWTTYDSALRVGPNDPSYVARLQELIVAYMWLRNSLPLAATAEIAIPAGHGEPTMLGRLRWAEEQYANGTGQADAPTALDALWGLLDSGALRTVVHSTSAFESPGIRGGGNDPMTEALLRAGDIVGTHVRTASRTFPLSAAATQMATYPSVYSFLQGGLPRPEARDTESSLRRQDESLVLDNDDAHRVASYVVSGTLPPPPVRAAAVPTRASTRARKQNVKKDGLDENQLMEIDDNPFDPKSYV